MNTPNLASYLTDHHSASVAALGLLDHLSSLPLPSEVLDTLKPLSNEIKAERDTLLEVIKSLGSNSSKSGQTASWVMEQLAWTRLFRVPGIPQELALFESFEALYLAVSGKSALWRVLAALPEANQSAKDVHFTKLEEQSNQQQTILESLRLQYAVLAFK